MRGLVPRIHAFSRCAARRGWPRGHKGVYARLATCCGPAMKLNRFSIIGKRSRHAEIQTSVSCLIIRSRLEIALGRLGSSDTERSAARTFLVNDDGAEAALPELVGAFSPLAR